jgi:hypothetical protein
MDNAEITIESKGCSRSAYKGKYTIWRLVAMIAITMWMFTLGLAIYYHSRPIGEVTVIYPSRGIK